jgi:Spy/CpxP family protein refolding chaperone
MKLIRVMALALALPLAALAQAPPADAPPAFGHGHAPMGKWWKDSDTVKKLNLSDAQVSQLDALVAGKHDRMMQLGQAVEAESTKLKGLLNTEALDDALINAQLEKVLQARSNMEREFTGILLGTRKILTLDQWRQLEALHPMRDHLRHFRGGPGGPDGPAPPPPGDF